jgi:hypothetical protein
MLVCEPTATATRLSSPFDKTTEHNSKNKSRQREANNRSATQEFARPLCNQSSEPFSQQPLPKYVQSPHSHHISHGKYIVVPVHVIKAYRGSIGIAPVILNPSSTWRLVVNFKALWLYTREWTPVPTEQEAVWAPEPVWTFGEKSLMPLPGFELLIHQLVVQSLYWLRYPGYLNSHDLF